VKRISIFGPESTGKTTLATRLAAHFETVAVPEYARTLLEARHLQENQIDEATIEQIARGQIASEEALARTANRYLFCDTDILTTTVWSEELLGRCPAWITSQARRRRYDLTLLTDVDTPWVADPVRFRPNERTSFFERCEDRLKAVGRPYHPLRGSWAERWVHANDAIRALGV
jgi:NadR type nicotinamide-nucleotide adenylyltransferase